MLADRTGSPAGLAGLSLIHAVVPAAARGAASSPSPAARLCLAPWPRSTALPLFHLYGDPPDDQAFDFIHVETISSRSSAHDWLIRAHRHRNLFQILLIERGGGEMTFEAASLGLPRRPRSWCRRQRRTASAFTPDVTDGWVVSFTEDVAEALGERSGEALKRLKALAAEPVIPLGHAAEIKRLVRALRRPARGRLPRARRLSPGDARTARADRDRGGAACREPRAHRRGDAGARRTPPSRRCAGWSKSISEKSG